jgi:hypothetical protein
MRNHRLPKTLQAPPSQAAFQACSHRKVQIDVQQAERYVLNTLEVKLIDIGLNGVQVADTIQLQCSVEPAFIVV